MLLVAVLRIKIRVVKNLYWLVTWSTGTDQENCSQCLSS